MTQGDRPKVRSARIYLIKGQVSDEQFAAIKHTLINPVEAREASLEKFTTLAATYDIPTTVETLDGFTRLFGGRAGRLYRPLRPRDGL